jgi:hypothetical protein
MSRPGGEGAMARAQFWLSGAVVRNQQSGPEYFDVVDDQPWSDRDGFHRGFASSFRLRPGREAWFHIPLPTPSILPEASALEVDGITLLWETEGAARIGWVTLHHGGVHRFELSPRLGEVTGTLQPAPETERGPKCAMLRSDFPVEPRLPIVFGLQISVMVLTPGDSDGTIRFYGAGASYSAAG